MLRLPAVLLKPFSVESTLSSVSQSFQEVSNILRIVLEHWKEELPALLDGKISDSTVPDELHEVMFDFVLVQLRGVDCSDELAEIVVMDFA